MKLKILLGLTTLQLEVNDIMLKNSFLVPVASPSIGLSEAKSVFRQINSKWISMGKKVEEFEKKICKEIGCKHAITVNNGTSALDALLTAFNINENDEVIIPSLTYISSANVVLYKKAKLVLCDCDLKTFNVDYKDLKKKITKKTKLIITTDLKGMPVDYDEIRKIIKNKNIHLISDSAESFGSTYKGKKVGTQFIAHTFSFFANKNITTGEGGVITTNNKSLAKKLRMIRNQGQNRRYNHILLGNNYRMTDVTAAIGVEQLKKLKIILKKKQLIAEFYNKELNKIEGITVPFVPQFVTQHSWYNYSIKLKKNLRDKLIRFLENKGIETRLSFPPIHIQPYYIKKFKFKKNQFINSIGSYQTFLDLPIYANLNKKDLNYVINSIKIFFRKTK